MTRRRAGDIEVEVVDDDPGRQTLHRLLDEVLDRRPDLQPQILRMLRQVMDRLSTPDAVILMRLLTGAKQVADAIQAKNRSGY